MFRLAAGVIGGFVNRFPICSAVDEVHARDFILKQRIFFNASAAADGRVNVSPRDAASFRVLGPHMAAYLDRTGSGNEMGRYLKSGDIVELEIEKIGVLRNTVGRG